jgi:hypothetical protein
VNYKDVAELTFRELLLAHREVSFEVLRRIWPFIVGVVVIAAILMWLDNRK